ncbi:MAG TPA: MFS transporter [Gaiellaceae bacterium]|nr:MFS transporter [Gaiellaceae bacterium]
MSLWRHRDFMRLWAGETVSVFGSQVTELALPLAAVLTLHATAFQMGLLSAAGMAPWIAFALLVGVWVDRRLRRRWILVAADLGRAAILLSVPVAAIFHVLSLGQLFAVAFAAGCLTLAFNVAWGSYLNVLVPREQLVDGNAKLMGSYATAQIAGPSLAGVLVQAVTAPFAILLDATSFLVSALALRSIRAPEPERRLERGSSLRRDLVAGLRFVRDDPLQRAIAGSAATLNFFGAAILAVIVLYAVRKLHLSSGLIGLAFAAGAVGALLGTQLAPRLTRRLGAGRTILLATLGFPPTLAIVPLASPGQPAWLAVTVLAAAEAVGGIAVMVFDVNTAALRQAATPEHLYGRAAGAMSFLTQSAKPLGSLFGGTVATAVGVHPTLWICAAGGLLVIPWTVFSPLRGRSDARGDRSGGEDGYERLGVDLAELAHGGEQDDEHEREHPGRRRERAHQLSPGAR